MLDTGQHYACPQETAQGHEPTITKGRQEFPHTQPPNHRLSVKRKTTYSVKGTKRRAGPRPWDPRTGPGPGQIPAPAPFQAPKVQGSTSPPLLREPDAISRDLNQDDAPDPLPCSARGNAYDNLSQEIQHPTGHSRAKPHHRRVR